MRAPDASAGKRGQCPQCGNVNTIPAASDAGTLEEEAGASTATGTIEFPCGSCGKQMRTPASAAGKKGKCPACSAVFTIPAAVAKSAAAPARPVPTGPIEFACSNCGHTVKTPGSAAGKKGKCPRCQAVIDIPYESTRRPAASPNPFAGGGLTPLDGGLTPLDGGLTPLGGGLSPLDGGLGASGGFGAAGGFGDDLFGAMPASGAVGADPFAGAGGFAAMPAQAANPYASTPVYGGSSGGGRSGGGKPNDSNRRGMPWECGQGFWATVSTVLLQPSSGFQAMKRSGNNLVRVLGFAYLSALFASFAYVVFYSIIQAAVLLGGLGPTGQMIAERPIGVRLVALAITVGVYVVTLPISMALGTTISLFIGSGIVHVCLLITGGARYGYEVTLRVNSYVIGANTILGAIPCLNIITFVTYPLSAIIGLREAHQTDTWRAALAVFLPLMVCCVLFGGLFFFGFFAAFTAALQQAG